MHQERWAVSAGGNPIQLHQGGGLGPGILLIGGVHGDEPLGVELAEELLTHLQNHPTPTRWHLIPCLNMDGYLEGTRGNARGVDLNRNFPSATWTPQARSPRYYPGASAGSEPETRAVVNLIREVKPRLIVHFHSWEPCVVLTGGVGLTEAQLLAASSGYPLKEDIGYPTPGSLGEFAWGELGIPVICTEEWDEAAPRSTWKRFGPGLLQILNARPA